MFSCKCLIEAYLQYRFRHLINLFQAIVPSFYTIWKHKKKLELFAKIFNSYIFNQRLFLFEHIEISVDFLTRKSIN